MGFNSGFKGLREELIRFFPFTSSPVRYRVPSHFNWTLPEIARETSQSCVVFTLHQYRKEWQFIVLLPDNQYSLFCGVL
jgi:hypothetical protein